MPSSLCAMLATSRLQPLQLQVLLEAPPPQHSEANPNLSPRAHWQPADRSAVALGAAMLAGGACAARHLMRRHRRWTAIGSRGAWRLQTGSRPKHIRQAGFMPDTFTEVMEPLEQEPKSGEPHEEEHVRVRFAPSPTGVLHVGGARTALFNWLFAKSLNGTMVLRVEDTDVARSTKESEEAILQALHWCGLNWDEGPDVGGPHGPYRQSQRLEAGIYQKYLDQLMESGHAYRCFLTPEEIDEMRRYAEQNEEVFVLESRWANASKEEVQEMLDKGAPFSYRFRMPMDREVMIRDEVLGDVEWDVAELGGDFIIVRGNGMPTYNFSVVIDDACMEITHVFRAQEHLMNTPKQVLIYEALGFPVPKFGHMPLILAPDRSKLSKRHGAASVGDYRELGYLPSGLINYLAHLGWNDGTNKEIYSMQELVDSFTMERTSKVAAVFDLDKCRWVNANHLRSLDDEEAAKMLGEELKAKGVVKEVGTPFVQKASAMLRDRISTFSESSQELTQFMGFPLEELLESDLGKKMAEDIRETAQALLSEEVRAQLPSLGDDPAVLKKVAADVSKARGGVKGKKLQLPLRLCLTANNAGPNLTLLFAVIAAVDDTVLCDCVPLEKRLEKLEELLQ